MVATHSRMLMNIEHKSQGNPDIHRLGRIFHYSVAVGIFASMSTCLCSVCCTGVSHGDRLIAVLTFGITGRRQHYVAQKNGGVDIRAFTFCVLSRLRLSIR
jgi:hypothetical protein